MGYRYLPPARTVEPLTLQTAPADRNSKLRVSIPANTMTDHDVLLIEHAAWNVLNGGGFYVDLSIDGVLVRGETNIYGASPGYPVFGHVLLTTKGGILTLLAGSAGTGEIWTDTSGYSMSAAMELAYFGDDDAGCNFMLQPQILKGIT